jgi:hypothetical protein
MLIAAVAGAWLFLLFGNINGIERAPWPKGLSARPLLRRRWSAARPKSQAQIL